jgi:anthranilate synthase component II
MLLMIDNYDSFTFNVVQYLSELGEDVRVYRNDEITIPDIRELSPDVIVISPGPCTPNEAGISMDVVRAFEGEIPILGICLGHQSIGQVYGGKIIKAGQVMHGKTSLIHHTGEDVFVGLANPLTATRYHSLVVEKESLPDCLEVIAWTENDNGELEEIMGVRHREFLMTGVQFHPESILTEHGHDLLGNFLNLAKGKS